MLSRLLLYVTQNTIFLVKGTLIYLKLEFNNIFCDECISLLTFLKLLKELYTCITRLLYMHETYTYMYVHGSGPYTTTLQTFYTCIQNNSDNTCILVIAYAYNRNNFLIAFQIEY